MYLCLQSFCITAYIFFQSQNTAEPFPYCVLLSLLSRGTWRCCAAPQQQRDTPGISFCSTARAGVQHPPWMGGSRVALYIQGGVAKNWASQARNPPETDGICDKDSDSSSGSGDQTSPRMGWTGGHKPERAPE